MHRLVSMAYAGFCGVSSIRKAFSEYTNLVYGIYILFYVVLYNNVMANTARRSLELKCTSLCIIRIRTIIVFDNVF